MNKESKFTLQRVLPEEYQKPDGIEYLIAAIAVIIVIGTITLT